MDFRLHAGDEAEESKGIKELSDIYEHHRLEEKTRMMNSSVPNVPDINIGDRVYWVNEPDPLGRRPFEANAMSDTCATLLASGVEQTVHKSQLRTNRGPLPSLTGDLRVDEFIIFTWDEAFAVVGKLTAVNRPELCAPETEAGVTVNECKKWLPLWKIRGGSGPPA